MIGDRRPVGRIGARTVVALVLGLVPLLCPALARAEGKVEFNRDIRPILSENCYYCHGPDKNHRQADLRLDLRAVALEKEAIVPGQPDESELVFRVASDDPAELMPPPKSGKTLTKAQKDLLKHWVAEGAEYQPHWAYITPSLPAEPAVRMSPWIRNPIDRFILATLESKGLTPSDEADRRTLLRRLSLDLIGLPPKPEEVEAFVKDSDPRAYEKAVDRLLASPHFGERMAVPWLDLARFTDTVGYHGDQNQNIFPYRDYVINSFNKNKPFDQFTIEQLAGDLLPGATVEQVVATGFNRLNMVTREGGAQPKEYLAKYAADRVRTVAITWLGSTMGCAECHDHKFDPFSARDFYSLAAFFGDVKQWGVYSDYKYTPNPDLKGWTNDHPFPPEIVVESPYLKRRSDQFTKRMAEVVAEFAARISADKARQAGFESWVDEGRRFLDVAPSGWATPPASVETVEKTEIQVVAQEDGSLLLTGKPTAMTRKGGELKVRLDLPPGRLASIRLEALPHDEHKGRIVRGDADGANVRLAATLRRAKSKAAPLTFHDADADRKDERYANGAAILGVKDLWKTSSRHPRETQTAVWQLAQPIAVKAGDQLDLTVTSDALGCVRLSVSPFAWDDPRSAVPDRKLFSAFFADRDRRTSEQSAILHAFHLRGGADPKALAEYRDIERQRRECRDGKTFTLVTEAWEYRPSRVLPRGNWQDESGPPVEPAVPHFLPQPPDAGSQRLTRLDLARWLTSPENPLTARVFVNRLWKQFFGNGLSGVVEDLGSQGEWPSHPELLDWLAVEFRKSGWNVKHMVKLMVMSASYRQDSRSRPELRDIDPNNRLLAFQSPRRLDAEFVRDNALAIAGLLTAEIGGASARPYQPADYYANLQFPDRDYVPHTDERQYRRGIYAHWQRTFLQPMMANFDAPSREECTPSRTVANTPQQALTLLNDPSFVEAARALAVKLLTTDAPSDRERIDLLFRKALARPAQAREAEALTTFLGSQRDVYRTSPGDAAKLLHVGLLPTPSGIDSIELAAWTNVCRVVLNLHESITRY